MKKFVALALALVMVFALCACGSKPAATGGDDKNTAYVLTQVGDTYSQGLGNYFVEAFKAAGGEVVAESFPENTTDFTAYLQNAINAKADVIFAPNSTTVAANLIKQAADKGIEMPILAGDTWESSVILEAAAGTDLAVYCSTFFDENDESGAAKEFVTGFKAWLNANSQYLTNNGGNDIVAAVSALGFDAYNTAYAAIEAALNANAAATSLDVATALWAVSLDNAVTGSIKFDQTGDAIKDSAYIKKAASAESFEFVKTQSVENSATQGTAVDYSAVKASNPVVVNDTVYVGVYEPQSGDNGAGGKQEILGIQYANSVKNTVTAGGKEYKVELVIVDNESSDAKAVSAASELVNKGVCVSLGSYGSGVSIAASDTFYNAGVPAIGCSCTNPSVTEGHDLYFRICFLDPFQGSVMAGFAESLIAG
jgi:ABC-type branched-subunit amino acid transport system substrate-binding protein